MSENSGESKLTLGQRVRMFRERLGANQRQLSERSQLTQATISRIESGQFKTLKPDNLRKLAIGLGITVEYLVGEKNSLTPAELLCANPDAVELLDWYQDLSLRSRRLALAYMKTLAEWDEEELQTEEAEREKDLEEEGLSQPWE